MNHGDEWRLRTIEDTRSLGRLATSFDSVGESGNTDHAKLASKITFLPPFLCTYQQLQSRKLVPEALRGAESEYVVAASRFDVFSRQNLTFQSRFLVKVV